MVPYPAEQCQRARAKYLHRCAIRWSKRHRRVQLGLVRAVWSGIFLILINKYFLNILLKKLTRENSMISTAKGSLQLPRTLTTL